VDLEKNTLYREIIMEHYKNPQNSGLVPHLKEYSVKNPVCGDSIIVQLEIENDIIKNIHQKSIGCSISTSSTSIMSELIKGKNILEVKKIINNYYKMVKGEPYDESCNLEEASVFSGVKDYPARFHCATASVDAILKAIRDYEKQKKEE